MTKHPCGVNPDAINLFSRNGEISFLYPFSLIKHSESAYGDEEYVKSITRRRVRAIAYTVKGRKIPCATHEIASELLPGLSEEYLKEAEWMWGNYKRICGGLDYSNFVRMSLDFFFDPDIVAEEYDWLLWIKGLVAEKASDARILKVNVPPSLEIYIDAFPGISKFEKIKRMRKFLNDMFLAHYHLLTLSERKYAIEAKFCRGVYVGIEKSRLDEVSDEMEIKRYFPEKYLIDRVMYRKFVKEEKEFIEQNSPFVVAKK